MGKKRQLDDASHILKASAISKNYPSNIKNKNRRRNRSNKKTKKDSYSTIFTNNATELEDSASAGYFAQDVSDACTDAADVSDALDTKYLGIYTQSISKQILSFSQKLILCTTLIATYLLIRLHCQNFTIFFCFLLNILYFYVTTFKLCLFIRGRNVALHNKTKELYITSTQKFYKKHIDKNCQKTRFCINNGNTSNFPYYSILLPLYKESNVVQKLIQSITNLQYPKDRLQVLLILEKDDAETIQAIQNVTLSHYFQVIKVPSTQPRTKAKACNYALNFVYGAYVTIFDAEDIPDPHQLLRALHAFEDGDETLVCVQARLNYYNYEENWLTKMFGVEYAILFDYLLPAIAEKQLPMPLGGSSNHFKFKTLKNLQGWDIFNVTEDADIGIRVACDKLKIKVIDSYTFEESPITIKAWLMQRARWIKGHTQTYLIHMRNPIKMYKILGKLGFASFNYMLGLPTIAMLLTPLGVLITLANACNLLNFPGTISHLIFFFAVCNFLFWVISTIYTAVLTAQDKDWNNFYKLCFLFPCYFVLHIIAAFLAIYQLCTKPFHWDKTTHGLSKNSPSKLI
ncbi:glycosyltransferase XagB [Alphaproteobacteria bacterium]